MNLFAATPAKRALPAPLYRMWQGVDGLLINIQRIDDAPARQALSLHCYSLYARMSKVDRAHSLRLYQWLLLQGYADADLLVAALLHDTGKSAARIGIWHRTVKVLLRRFRPQSWKRLSTPAPGGSWRFPFYVLHIHPALGARWARQCGCSETTAWLIRYHETDIDDTDARSSLMAALQTADAIN